MQEKKQNSENSFPNKKYKMKVAYPLHFAISHPASTFTVVSYKLLCYAVGVYLI